MFRFLAAALTAFATLAPTIASADSCWWHNGSLMRLSAYGEGRAFHYENPRPELARAGVRPGTMLFNGRNQGGNYSGAAQVFSSACPGQPMMYQVQGNVGANQTSVTLYGTRPVRQGCVATGAFTQDTLHFTYAFQC